MAGFYILHQRQKANNRVNLPTLDEINLFVRSDFSCEREDGVQRRDMLRSSLYLLRACIHRWRSLNALARSGYFAEIHTFVLVWQI